MWRESNALSVDDIIKRANYRTWGTRAWCERALNPWRRPVRLCNSSNWKLHWQNATAPMYGKCPSPDEAATAQSKHLKKMAGTLNSTRDENAKAKHWNYESVVSVFSTSVVSLLLMGGKYANGAGRGFIPQEHEPSGCDTLMKAFRQVRHKIRRYRQKGWAYTAVAMLKNKALPLIPHHITNFVLFSFLFRFKNADTSIKFL